MTHIASIGAGLYSDLSVADGTGEDWSLEANYDTEAELKDAFTDEIASQGGTPGAGTYVRITNVREFPSMGTPPNIVNVPVYGQATSQQIQGQADAPSIELTLNYVAADWADGTELGDMVGDGILHLFRFTLLNAEPTTNYDSDSVGGAAGLGTKENSIYFWVGKIEALQVNPQLTDSNTATVTVSIQSDFFGAYTVDP
jgi:hypothetical protein